VAERVFERLVQDVDANFEKGLYGVSIPTHLLPLRHAFGIDFVHR
jgi:hypothetical protein